MQSKTRKGGKLPPDGSIDWGDNSGQLAGLITEATTSSICTPKSHSIQMARHDLSNTRMSLEEMPTMEENPEGVISDGCEPSASFTETYGTWTTKGAKRKKRTSDENEQVPQKKPCGAADSLTNLDSTNLLNVEGEDSCHVRETIKDRPLQQVKVNNLGQMLKSNEFNDSSTSAKGCIVIVEPIGSDIEQSQFLGRSIEIVKLVDRSIFGKVGYANMRVNFKKKHLVIELKSAASMGSVLEITELGRWRVKCHQPISHVTSYGVIHPVGLETSLEEIQESLNLRQDQQGIKPFRLVKYRDGNVTETRNIKLVFPTMNRPSYIYLESQRFKVDPYVDRLRQCYQCQGFGHIAKNCFSKKLKCVVCAGEHQLKDCPKEKICCANCGGNHSASYGGCQKMKDAQRVEQLKAFQNVTHQEAITLMRDAYKKSEDPDQTNVPRRDQHGEPNVGNIWFSKKRQEVGQGNITVMPERQVMITNDRPQLTLATREVGCQTVEKHEIACQTAISQDFPCPSVIVPNQQDESVLVSSFTPDEKFCACLVELLTTLENKSYSIHQKCVIASDITKKHFGVTIAPELVEATVGVPDGGAIGPPISGVSDNSQTRAKNAKTKQQTQPSAEHIRDLYKGKKTKPFGRTISSNIR
jgi:hypothetical protein